MKTLFKAPLRFVWRLTFFIRRPLHARLARLLAETVRDPLLIEHRQGRNAQIDELAARVTIDGESLRRELDLSLKSCIREIVRLERQIEALRESVEALEAQDSTSQARSTGRSLVLVSESSANVTNRV